MVLSTFRAFGLAFTIGQTVAAQSLMRAYGGSLHAQLVIKTLLHREDQG